MNPIPKYCVLQPSSLQSFPPLRLPSLSLQSHEAPHQQARVQRITSAITAIAKPESSQPPHQEVEVAHSGFVSSHPEVWVTESWES